MRLILLSGGIDSSAIAFWSSPDIAVTVDYGQRPVRGEIEAAEAIASILSIRHEVIKVDLSPLGIGPLAHRPPSKLARAPEWWPYRNQMLITLAGMRFVTEGLREIIIGTVKSDAHADGRAPFLRAIDRVMSIQEGEVHVTAPARQLSTLQLLSSSGFPTELLGLTFSCHVHEYPCGQCRGCLKHRAVLHALNP